MIIIVITALLLISTYFLLNNRDSFHLTTTLSLTIIILISQKIIISLISLLQIIIKIMKTCDLQSDKSCLLFSVKIKAQKLLFLNCKIVEVIKLNHL